MSLGSSGGSDTQTTVQKTELPAWVEQAGEQLYGTAQPVAERQYPFYDDPRISGFTPDQQAAFDLARSNVGNWEPSFANAFFGYGAAGDQFNPYNAQGYAAPYQAAIAGPTEPFTNAAGSFTQQAGSANTAFSDPFLSQMFLNAGAGRGTEGAYGALGAGGAPLNQADIDRYFNPYVQDVQQTAITEINRQYERDKISRDASMVNRGSYLNEDRREVIDNLSGESRDRVIAEMVARTNADAWNASIGAANADSSRALSAAQQYGGLANDSSGRSAQALAASLGVRGEDLNRMLGAGGQFTNLAQLGAQIGSGGLQAALGTRNDDLSRLLQSSGGFSDLGSQIQDQSYQDASNILGIGGQIQQQQQNEMNLSYNEFLRQFYFPQEQLNWLQGMLQGTPYGQTTTGQQPVASSSGLAQGLGGIGAFMGGLGALGFEL